MPMSEFLSCDWGTSNFRLRLVKDGEVVAELSTDEGIDQLAGSGPGTFKERFAARVVRLSAEVLRDLSGLPAVISGMASSSIGWRQLPYATLTPPWSRFPPISSVLVTHHPKAARQHDDRVE